MEWEEGKSSTKMHHGIDPPRDLKKYISELFEEALSIRPHLHWYRIDPQALTPSHLESIMHQRHLKKEWQSSLRTGIERHLPNLEIEQFDYTYSKLHKACMETVTAAEAGVRGEVKRILKLCPRGGQRLERRCTLAREHKWKNLWALVTNSRNESTGSYICQAGQCKLNAATESKGMALIQCGCTILAIMHSVLWAGFQMACRQYRVFKHLNWPT